MTTKMEKKMIGNFYRLSEENIELKAEIERLRADAKQSEIVIESRMELIDRQAYRIKKMEDALAEERARRNAHVDEDTWRYLERRKDVLLEEYLGDARQELQEEGKIGNGDHFQDTPKMVWQITEERKNALRFSISGEMSPTCSCKCCKDAIATIRAMLEEA